MTVILGPEMAAPILWAPGISGFFLLEKFNPHAHKIPPFRGGGSWFFWKGGGGSADFIFMGVGIFPIQRAHQMSRMRAEGVVLCERACFRLPGTL